VGRGVLVAGTTSDAGKSLVTAAICRWLVRQGVRVAPFKAQNMSNNSMVCPDGGEIGRAQWVQAKACRVVPEAAMNPVLLKPGSDHRSHVVLMGQPWGELQAGEFATARKYLAEKAFEAFADLSSRYDVVIAEGAGSPAEVNLRSGDYVNMGLARAVDLPVVVVGDFDRGGVLAAMYGTLKLLDEADQANIKAWIINKFRGDLDLLQPGLRMLEERTARPVLGVLPYLHDVWLDSEDSLAISGWLASAPSRGTSGTLTVAIVRFPRISNTTDVDALAAEPGVSVRVTADPAEVASANLVVLPGSRSTLSDLQWMRSRGLGGTVMGRAAAGRPVVGTAVATRCSPTRSTTHWRLSLPLRPRYPALGCCQSRFTSLGTSSWAHPVGSGEDSKWSHMRSTTECPRPCGPVALGLLVALTSLALPNRFLTVGGWVRCLGRPGTGCSRTTGSVAHSWPRPHSWLESRGVPNQARRASPDAGKSCWTDSPML